MPTGKPYSLYKRNRIYYVQFKLPDGRYCTARSTGETSKSKAERVAFDYLSAGQVVVKQNLTLAEFSKDFFSWDSPWAAEKRIRGLRIGKRQCHNLNYLLRAHIVPKMGSVKLVNIDRMMIRELRNDLFVKKYSGNTINKVLSALKAILEAAEEQSLIQFIPRIDRAAANPKKKDILTIEETRRLFSIPWISDPGHCHPPKEQLMGYIGNMLAASTGMRMGEIQGLVLSDLCLNEGYIRVRRSWDRLYGLNDTTKSGRSRRVYIPGAVAEKLHTLMELNPNTSNPESFLFFSERTVGKPVEPKVFIRSLYTAMRNIGISEPERKERNITFHSWRHLFNSVLANGNVPLLKIQSLTGHVTDEMSKHYYHTDDMRDVLEVIRGSILAGLPDEQEMVQ